MSKQKLTPWFQAGVKPVHIGVYETVNADKSDKSPTYQRWNGKYWEYMAMTPYECNIHSASANEKPRWRGLKEPADAAQ